ncbi:MAG TPA: cysteine desulfurase NifS [Sedimentibacter sp.]|nr:cysteine desulfurase NifS [Sedimentibacter sp.]HHY99860.1 cysteine desulfurase NifS [Tissierellia bacterium]HOK48697.1 cysteine desulfurase NifS [Sedimentibacter sp.]HOW23297.1 cysteine desulfurase NifS [Sedimentibacter sp.]HRC81949.1 cysteine desulfurase NifS [Sedimentibacter sp.]
MSKKLYLDNAATTRVKREVLDEMRQYFDELYGNPSSQLYELGRKSKQAIEKARKTLADFINADEKEIYFTAGGTESDNWALKGVAFANFNKGKNHIITTKIEHHAILHTCEYLEKFGVETTYLDVDRYGLVDLEQLKESIRPETMLISVMYANNEIGTIQPIEEIGKIAKEHGILFHVDAVQAFGSIRIDVNKLNIDLMSMSAHKLGGPKGIGGMYIRKGTRIDNFIHGGGQERGRRAGTEGVQNIVGFGKAVEIASRNLDERAERLTALRNRLVEGIKNNIPDVVLNGHPTRRLPNNVNFSFKYVEGESILLLLDMEGISASSGSACTSGSLDPSHVLLATGLDHGTAHGSIRFTLSEEITEEDIDYTVETMKNIIAKLRAMSPIKNDEDLKKN